MGDCRTPAKRRLGIQQAHLGAVIPTTVGELVCMYVCIYIIDIPNLIFKIAVRRQEREQGGVGRSRGEYGGSTGEYNRVV